MQLVGHSERVVPGKGYRKVARPATFQHARSRSSDVPTSIHFEASHWSFEFEHARHRFFVRNYFLVANSSTDARGVVGKMMGKVVRHAIGFGQFRCRHLKDAPAPAGYSREVPNRSAIVGACGSPTL